MDDGRRTFVDRWLAGEIADPAAAIDDYIASWHEPRRVTPPSETLYRWLGFTQTQWECIVERPASLTSVLADIRANVDAWPPAPVISHEGFELQLYPDGTLGVSAGYDEYATTFPADVVRGLVRTPESDRAIALAVLDELDGSQHEVQILRRRVEAGEWKAPQ